MQREDLTTSAQLISQPDERAGPFHPSPSPHPSHCPGPLGRGVAVPQGRLELRARLGEPQPRAAATTLPQLGNESPLGGSAPRPLCAPPAPLCSLTGTSPTSEPCAASQTHVNGGLQPSSCHSTSMSSWGGTKTKPRVLGKAEGQPTCTTPSSCPLTTAMQTLSNAPCQEPSSVRTGARCRGEKEHVLSISNRRGDRHV